MKKIALYLFVGLVSLMGGKVWAVSDGDNSVTPVYEDVASSTTFRVVPPREDQWVLISSAPSKSGRLMDNGDKISAWRYREVINCSTGSLQLSPDPYAFATYTATAPVVLSSDTSKNAGQYNGDAYGPPWQGEIWGRWNEGQGGLGGACVTENYNLE